MNIKQLRQTILDRAIRGQLVSQDPTDEPASVLLERIRAEKEELIKEKKLKREKRESQPIEEVPFEIPKGWVWCRLGEIQQVVTGSTPTKKNDEYYGNDYPFYKPTDLDAAYYVMTAQDNLSSLGYGEARKLPEKSILVTCIGATIGKTGLIRREGSCNQQINAILPNSNISPEFSYFVCISSFFQNNIIQNASATTLPILNKSKFEELLFPLPPLAEQHRIVEKIEQLLAIVDTIEQLQEELKSDVKQAKSQVLSDAIAGKLTHQDPNDEPAEELLKRIGKTTATDIPYEKILPKGWAWCKLGDLSEFIRNGISIKQDKGLKGYPITRIETISDGSINRERMGYADVYDLSKYEQYLLTKGDILLSHINSPIHIGKSAVYTPISDEEKIIHGMNLLCIRLKEVDSCFINYFFNSKTFRYSLFPFIKHAVNQASINIGNLRNIYIPLPPLAEQHRIVQQIEMYFAAFDKIKNELI